MCNCSAVRSLLLLVLLAGIWLRWPSPGVLPGYDERLYVGYVDNLRQHHDFPRVVAEFLRLESGGTDKLAPPTRCLHLLQAWAWAESSGRGSFAALRDVSFAMSVATLLAAAGFGYRLQGWPGGLAAAALMACAPLQLHSAQRGLLDGSFSFWALLTLWALWEAARRPGLAGAYGGAVVGMFLAKETAVFWWVGLLPVLWMLGAERRLWLATLVAPVGAALVLLILCGGVRPFLAVVHVDLHSPLSAYTLAHHDGPWFGYPLAMFVLSPLLCSIACASALGRGSRWMTLVLLGSMAALSCLPYQIVPRLATMWDFPLRWLAWEQVQGTRRTYQVAIVLLLCALDMRQWYLFFVQDAVYDPATDTLLRSLQVVK